MEPVGKKLDRIAYLMRVVLQSRHYAGLYQKFSINLESEGKLPKMSKSWGARVREKVKKISNRGFQKQIILAITDKIRIFQFNRKNRG